MMNNKWLNLQLFAEGEGGGDGAASVGGAATSPADDGQAKLRALGVPEDRLQKRAKREAARQLPKGAVSTKPAQAQQEQQPKEQVASAGNPTEEKPAKMSWDEIMKDPDYNKEMQKTIQARLRGSKAAEENLGKLGPALEVLARKYGQDINNLDYGALATAIHNDDEYYEDKALEMGVSVQKAREIDQHERETARQQRIEQMNLEQRKIANHFASLEQQGNELKKTFPNFDLRAELQNPVFARMTSPNVGISVADAYYAIHRKEIQAAAMQVTAQKTAQKLSNSIQSGQRRPAEAGTSSQAPSVPTFDYKNLTPKQRAEIKRRVAEAKARGEKLYPGQL